VGGAPEAFIGSMVSDIAAGATEEFTATWVPPSEGHYCVIVRIPLYQTPATPPATPVVEMTELNNVAQSNYDRFISASSSPPSREVTFVEVGNPYPVPTRVFLDPGQSNPLYRTYLEHTWLLLEPGETRKVMMMFEYAPDNLSNDVYPPELVQKYRELQRVPNAVAMMSRIEDPNDSPRHKLDVLGGTQAQIVTGKATRFRQFKVDDRRVRGSVVTADQGQPAPGQVLLRVHRGTARKPDYAYQTVKLVQGAFSAALEAEGHTVDAYYLPDAGFADCWSEAVKLRRQ
jgi:hypothetical protein